MLRFSRVWVRPTRAANLLSRSRSRLCCIVCCVCLWCAFAVFGCWPSLPHSRLGCALLCSAVLCFVCSSLVVCPSFVPRLQLTSRALAPSALVHSCTLHCHLHHERHTQLCQHATSSHHTRHHSAHAQRHHPPPPPRTMRQQARPNMRSTSRKHTKADDGAVNIAAAQHVTATATTAAAAAAAASSSASAPPPGRIYYTQPVVASAQQLQNPHWLNQLIQHSRQAGQTAHGLSRTTMSHTPA